MIQHVVMWTLLDPKDAPDFKAQLDSCAQVVSGIVSFVVGIHTAGLEANCHVVLVSQFVDAQALQAYQEHPHHKAVSGNLGKLRCTRHVLDFYI